MNLSRIASYVCPLTTMIIYMYILHSNMFCSIYRCNTSTYVLASCREQYKCYCSVHLNSPCMVIVNSFQVHSSWVCRTHNVHMSGPYSSIAVVVVMQYAHYGVWGLPKRVSGLVQMDTCYHCSTQLT